MVSRAFPIALLAAGLALAGLALARPPLLVPAMARPLAKPAYVYGTADLPLMPGLRQIAKNAVVFDAPGGLVVAADALSRRVAPAAIARFYRQALPELGWREIRPLLFSRSGERLRLSIHRHRGVTRVHFDLAPG